MCYKDLELHLVSFVRGCYTICPCTWANMEREVKWGFCLKATALMPAWSIFMLHFSHFVHYQTDDWRCRKGVRKHISFCFCFHRDFPNDHHPANLICQSQPFILSIFYTHFFLKRFGGMSGMWRSPKRGTFGRLSVIAMRFKSALYSCGGLWVELSESAQ